MTDTTPTADEAPTHLLDSLADPFFVVDDAWRYTYVNAHAAATMGVTPADLVGRVLWECFPEALDTRLVEEYHHVMRTRETRHFELYYPALAFWAEVKAFAHLQGIGVHFRDITERKLAEDRREALLDVTRALAAAVTLRDVAQATLSAGLAALGAYAGALLVRSGDALDIVLTSGYDEERVNAWRRIELSADLPITHAARTGTLVFLRARDLTETYPALATHKADRTLALAALPLVLAGEVIGVLALSFKTDRTFNPAERGFAEGLAGQVAQAVDRARLTEALARSEARNRTLVEATSQIVWTTPPDGQLTVAWEAWLDFTGQTPEESGGDGWSRALHPEDQERVLGAWHGAVRARTTFEERLRVRHVDGTYHIMEVRAAPVLDGHGGVREWVGVLNDVTDREQAQAALAQRDVELRAMIDEIPQLAWIADGSGLISWYNRRWYEYTGTTPEQMAGWGWRDVHHPDHVDRVIREVQGRWARGEPWEGTYLLRSHGGEYRWFLTRAVPIRNAQGQVVTWFGTNTDVTAQLAQRELLEAMVRERTEQLVKSNRDLEQFAYVASHDLRAPLRTVTSYLQLLQQRYAGQLDDRADTFINFAVNAAGRMSTLIEDVLTYSRLHRERRVTTVDLNQAVRDVLSNLRGVLDARGADVTVTDLPPVQADPTQVRQVLQNLIGNAVKFVPAGRAPAVHVSATREGAMVRLSVRDNGPGIAREYHERIFGVFQRLVRSDEAEGTGVGLAIVRKIVEEHSGTVTVESEEGQGAVFHVTLPAVDGT